MIAGTALSKSAAKLFFNERRESANRLENFGRDLVILDDDAEMLLKGRYDHHDRHRIELRNAAEETGRLIELASPVLEPKGTAEDFLYALYDHHSMVPFVPYP